MNVTKLAITAEDVETEDSLEITDIYDSHSARIILIEADPEDSECLFIIDDEVKIHKIVDNGEGKGTVLLTVDMSHHELEDEL